MKNNKQLKSSLNHYLAFFFRFVIIVLASFFLFIVIVQLIQLLKPLYSSSLSKHVDWLIIKFGKESSAIIVGVISLCGVAITALISNTVNREQRYNATVTQSRLEWIESFRQLLVSFIDTSVSQHNLLMKNNLFAEDHKNQESKLPLESESDQLELDTAELSRARLQFYSNSSSIKSTSSNLLLYLNPHEEKVDDISRIISDIVTQVSKSQYKELHSCTNAECNEDRQQAHKKEFKRLVDILVTDCRKYIKNEWDVIKQESR